MKKSKIIVPALGLLLLSTAASVSGTVAWFTASSSASFETNTFTVASSAGTLARTLVAGTGTALSAEDGSADSTKIQQATNTKLTDGSYNHSTGVVWSHNMNTPANDTTHCISKGTDSGTNWQAGTLGTDTLYHAVSWTVNFTYTFGSSNANQDFYFDVTSTMTASGIATNDTAKGFRIAIISTNTIVWAKLQTASNCKYIDSDTGTGITSQAKDYVAADHLIDSAVTTSMEGVVASDAVASNTSAINYLGTFTTGSATLSVKFVAWYEGTDPNVVNESTKTPVSAALSFFTRQAA